MKLSISLTAYSNINQTNTSKNGEFFKIPYSLIKKYCDKKNSKQKIEKTIESPETKTNADTITETISTLNSKNYIKTSLQTEKTEQENISQKRHKPKNKTKKNCKLLEEFTDEYNDLNKKNLNNSYSFNIDIAKKKQRKYFSVDKNYSSKNDEDRKKTENVISKKIWLENCNKNNKLKNYQALSSSIKNRYFNNKNRVLSTRIQKINTYTINFENKYNKNRFLTPFQKEINLNKSENSKKIEEENVECEELAQRHHGNNQKNNYGIKASNTTNNKKKPICMVMNPTKRKNIFLNSSSNVKTNTRKNNNLTKIRGKKFTFNDFSFIHYNQNKINSYIKKSQVKNNIFKKLNTTNSMIKKKTRNQNNESKTNIIYDSKKLNSTEVFGYFIKKCRPNLENRTNNYKRKVKNFEDLKKIIFGEIQKNVTNKKNKASN